MERNFFQVACGVRYVKLGELWRVRVKANGKPYESFEEWALEELQVDSIRTVQMMIQLAELVFQKLIPERELASPEGKQYVDKIISLDWSKALILLSKVRDRNEFEKYYEQAKYLTREELKQLLSGAPKNKEESKLETFPVKVTQTQKEVITMALARAKAMNDSANMNDSPVLNGYLLALICKHFLASTKDAN
jgi:hypothetical protein